VRWICAFLADNHSRDVIEGARLRSSAEKKIEARNLTIPGLVLLRGQDLNLRPLGFDRSSSIGLNVPTKLS